MIIRNLGKSFSVLALGAVLIPTIANAQDALGKMVVAFDGNHSRVEIKSKVDKALRLYDLPVNNEFRGRVGSTLVSLSNSNDVHKTEMQILQCVIDAYTPSADTTFPNMAGVCAKLR